ncbi:dihydrolipoyl dehydrogenase [Gluconacetobacter azotocaptans]|uniref:Dihydrolipoyl dehydrogenase n=1 Tax=Gluconacetobacter azotocaptans TaxID=142834 RepID=A0A7W4PEN0_9PROT|nr:dihydrolipoyl dehydrogenase [Gluconacetobacter azotocaptans]MBB2190933.1 dihydrolipoyl dehydrogenase [Gluconacetobacter azotocaptans]GBQ31784.1 dihydrolipoamide dehydrogenase [Gluconacetobacter azotocaptans DSM 13594]
MSKTEFDIVIVGGGPGGYVAAIRGAQLGLSVAVVEAAQLGGICLNWGCIPTKALLRSSEINHLLHHLGEFGFAADNIRFDLDKVVKRSRKVAGQLSSGVAHLLKKNKVTVFDGFAKLAGKDGARRKVDVSKDGKSVATLTAPHVILATGARARVLPGLEPDGKLIWSYREAMVPTELPKRLMVIGSGAIGVEFASFYRNMGAEVTLVEVLDRILPVEDEEISALAHKAFLKQGMTILTGAKIGAIRKNGDSVTVPVEAGGKSQEIAVDRVISAVGIVGNVENIGLEGTAIEVDRTHIKVDPYCRTGEAGVYAIGDIAGPPWLAHKASHEGVLCVEAIAGHTVHPIDPTNIPGCTYCRPQIASVGLTEARAKEAGHKIRVGRFPFIGNGKAIAAGEPEGMVKTIFDASTGELLGAHMIGAEVTEMIQGYVIARTSELTEAELKETVFPHPTISETMHEAVLAAYDGALHI